MAKTILHITFCKDFGGIFQSFINYSEALLKCGYEVILLIPRDAKFKEHLKGLFPNLEIISDKYIANKHGHNNPFAVYHFRKLLNKFKPDIILVHNSRPLKMLKRVSKIVPIVTVNHGTKSKYNIIPDKIFAVNASLRQRIIDNGQLQKNVYVLPNCIKVDCKKSIISPPSRAVPVIGFLGSFISNKGGYDFLDALTYLNRHNIKFLAIMAGSGPMEKEFKEYAKEMGISDQVEFPGWIKDKEAFFCNIDIFCLSSHSESFGIVLLEAMYNHVAIVSTDTEGPREILTNGVDGIISPIMNPVMLFKNLEYLLNNSEIRLKFAQEGYKNLTERFSFEIFSEKLEKLLLENNNN